METEGNFCQDLKKYVLWHSPVNSLMFTMLMMLDETIMDITGKDLGTITLQAIYIWGNCLFFNYKSKAFRNTLDIIDSTPKVRFIFY